MGTLTQQENKEFTCIKDDQIFKDIAFSSKILPLEKDIIKGPGDGMKMLQIMLINGCTRNAATGFRQLLVLLF